MFIGCLSNVFQQFSNRTLQQEICNHKSRHSSLKKRKARLAGPGNHLHWCPPPWWSFQFDPGKIGSHPQLANSTHPLENSTQQFATPGHHGVFKRCVLKIQDSTPPTHGSLKKKLGNSYGKFDTRPETHGSLGNFHFSGPQALGDIQPYNWQNWHCEWWYLSARGFTAFQKPLQVFYFIPNWSWSFGEIRKERTT